MVRALFVSLFLVVAVGCGSSSGSQAESDCNSLVDQYLCPKLVTCDPGYLTQAQCVIMVNQAMSCSSAKSENGELSACESDLTAEPCTTFIDAAGSRFSRPAAPTYSTKPTRR